MDEPPGCFFDVEGRDGVGYCFGPSGGKRAGIDAAHVMYSYTISCLRAGLGWDKMVSSVLSCGTVKKCKLLEALVEDTGVTNFEPARLLNAKLRESTYHQGRCYDVSFIA